MNKYTLAFYGRKVEAIGVRGFFQVDVVAESLGEAKLHLYANYDHISNVTVVNQEKVS